MALPMVFFDNANFPHLPPLIMQACHCYQVGNISTKHLCYCWFLTGLVVGALLSDLSTYSLARSMNLPSYDLLGYDFTSIEYTT